MSSNPDDIPQWLDPTLVQPTTPSGLEENVQQQQSHEFPYDPLLFQSFATSPDQDVAQQQYPISGLSEELLHSGVEPSSGPLRPWRMSREPPRQSGESQSSSGRTSPVSIRFVLCGAEGRRQ